MQLSEGQKMELSKLLITIGFGLVGVGLVVGVAARYPGLFSWFGNLPGDIRYESPSTLVFVPLTSMLVVSALLSGALWLIQRFRG